MGRALSAVTRQTILTMGFDGVHPLRIAGLTRVGRSTVYDVLQKAREGGDDIPRRPASGGRKRPEGVVRVLLWKADDVAAIDAAAKARGLDRPAVVNALVAACIRDRMIDAVLDDGVASGS